jgi:hypothetical protein
MPSGRMPEGPAALSNAERQARHRAKMHMLALRASLPAKRPKAAARRSRSQRWNEALAELLAVQAECAAWFEALPESLCESSTADALQEMIDLDLEAIAAVQPPQGYGRD